MIKTTNYDAPSMSALISGLKEVHLKSFSEEERAEISSKINKEDRWTREIVLAVFFASVIISRNALLVLCVFLLFSSGWLQSGTVHSIKEKSHILIALAFLFCILYYLWGTSELFWFSFRVLIGVTLLEGLKRVLIGFMNRKDILRLLSQNRIYIKEKLTARFVESSRMDEKKRRKVL
jgi:hypothetical protein